METVELSRKTVAIRDTRSVGLLRFRNSEFSKISDSHIPRPRKCPVKGPYTDAKNGRLWHTMPMSPPKIPEGRKLNIFLNATCRKTQCHKQCVETVSIPRVLIHSDTWDTSSDTPESLPATRTRNSNTMRWFVYGASGTLSTAIRNLLLQLRRAT